MNIIFSLALRTLYFVCLIGGLSVHTFAADNNTLVGSTVTTRQGLVRGTTQDSVCVWRGIPYAKQPVGDLRFRAPQAPESWSGIKEATVFTHVAPQTRRATKETIKQGEDCLSLNVWSPAADGKKRPVMVWLHGGGFLVGSGGSPLSILR
jgi:para-nitrobenzyl esterase